MLLLREVHGWLRYLLAHDPQCSGAGVVVQEIPSTFIPQNDYTDGVRTLAIHCLDRGLTPRIEVRFTTLRPQIVWYPANAAEGTLLALVNQFGMPCGDWKSWDVSDLCRYLVQQAKLRLCPENLAPELLLELLPPPPSAGEPVLPPVAEGAAKLDLSTTQRLVSAVQEGLRKGKFVTQKKIGEWVKANYGGGGWEQALRSFGDSVVTFYRAGKFGDEDLVSLVKEYAPGKTAYPPDELKRQLGAGYGNLPEKVREAFGVEALYTPAQAKARLGQILGKFLEGEGRPVTRLPFGENPVRLGQSLVAHFKSGALGLSLLGQFEVMDPGERLLPWSFIRRSAVAYKIAKAGAEEEEEGGDLPSLVVQWLEQTKLLLPLFKSDEGQEEAVKKAIKTQVEVHVQKTLGSEPWVRATLDSLVGVQDSTALRRALQTDFDLWLMDALAPAIERWKLPISPWAFSGEREDQAIYEKMVGLWTEHFKDFLREHRVDSNKRLSEALQHFYNLVADTWHPEKLASYSPRVPPVGKIIDSAGAGDREALLKTLVEDFEHELGQSIPAEVHHRLIESPFFNRAYHEVRLQSLKLDQRGAN